MEQLLSATNPSPKSVLYGIANQSNSVQILTRQAASLGLILEVGTDPTTLLEKLPQHFPTLIVAEVPLNEAGAFALLDRLQMRGCPAPVVFLSGEPDTGAVVEAMRRGAFGVHCYPVDEVKLLEMFRSGMVEHERRMNDHKIVADFQERLGTLSDSEREVLEAVCQGKLNKQIARELNVSVRTVEQRRRRIFRKMEVASAVPLACDIATARTLERVYNLRGAMI